MNLRFDLKTLQLFMSVVELKSFTRAADREHIATSAMSKRISDLEAALGATIFKRQARGVEPTAAGLALLKHAQAIFRDVETLVGEMADYATGTKGHVRMLSNRSSLMARLPDDISKFVFAHPDVKVDLEELPSPEVLQNVSEGRADIGVFTFGHAEPEGLEIFEYRQDRLIVLVPRKHPLSRRRSLRYADILQYDVVNLHTVTAWNHFLHHNADMLGQTLRTRFRVTSFDVLCALVGAGLGVALAPFGVLRFIPDRRLKEIQLDEPWANRKHMLCVRNAELLSAPAKTMLNHLLATSPNSPTGTIT